MSETMTNKMVITFSGKLTIRQHWLSMLNCRFSTSLLLAVSRWAKWWFLLLSSLERLELQFDQTSRVEARFVNRPVSLSNRGHQAVLIPSYNHCNMSSWSNKRFFCRTVTITGPGEKLPVCRSRWLNKSAFSSAAAAPPPPYKQLRPCSTAPDVITASTICHPTKLP